MNLNQQIKGKKGKKMKKQGKNMVSTSNLPPLLKMQGLTYSNKKISEKIIRVEGEDKTVHSNHFAIHSKLHKANPKIQLLNQMQ